VFSVVKLALLFFAFMPVLGQGQEATILLFWGGALVISILFVTAVTCRSGRLWQAPDFGLLISLLPKSFGHHFLNLVASAPAIAMPLLVAEVVSPEVNAAFFMSWMILQVILLGPASLATALYAAGPPKPDGLPDAATDRLRISLVISVLMCLAGTLGFLIFLNPMLALISPLLAQIGGPYLKYLGWGMFAEAAKYHYIAVMRLQTRMWRGSILVALIGLLEILGASAGGMIAGLPGLVFGWLLTVSLQAVLVLPTLLCASGVALCSTRSERDGGV